MRKRHYVWLSLCALSLIIFNYSSIQVGYGGSEDYVEFLDEIIANVTNSSICVIPSFDLVKRDLEHRQVFQRLGSLRCKQIQPELTFYENGIFRWNTTALKKITVPINCYASFVVRHSASDDFVSYSEEFLVEPGVDRKLGGSLVRVICYHEANGIRNGIIYNNVHQNAYAKKNKGPQIKEFPKNVLSKPKSVFILLIESLSRVNAHVQLPKTLRVLKNKFKALS